MRRAERLPPGSMFRGNELPRLMTMVISLVVLAMLIFRARDANTWRWLVGEGRAGGRAEQQAQPPRESPRNEGSQAAPAAPAAEKRPPDKLAAAKPSTEKPATEEPAAEMTSEGDSPIFAERKSGQSPERKSGQSPERKSGQSPEEPAETAAPKPPMIEGTDLDPLESSAAEEEFQVISDGTEQMKLDDMLAYRRLLRWARNQSYDAMAQRARGDLLYTHLYDTPEEYRGKLVQVKLSIRRVLKYDEKDARRIFADEAAGVQLYEVWGFSVEGKSALYCAVVIGLPEGFPVGDPIDERAMLVGYFFKLQGYQPRGPGQGRTLRAPLIVGRLAPIVVNNQLATGNELFWGLVAGGIILGLLALGGVFYALGRLWRKPQPPPGATTTGGGVGVEDWLGRTEMGYLDEGDDEGNNSDAGADSTNGEVTGNGHTADSSRLFPDRLDEGRAPGG